MTPVLNVTLMLLTGILPDAGLPEDGRTPLPTPDTLFARHVEAIGGADLVRATARLEATGTVTVKAAPCGSHLLDAIGVPGTFELRMEPGRMLLRHRLARIPVIEIGVVDDVAWYGVPLEEAELATGDDRLQLVRHADLGFDLDPERHYDELRTLERDEIDGHPVWRVLAIVRGPSGVI